MNNSMELSFKINNEEMEKLKKILISGGVRHYLIKITNGEELDVVEYKEYQKLEQENKELKIKLKELKDKEKNKDTRNSRQRVENKKLHMKNQELRDLNRIYKEIISDDKENYKLLSSEIKKLETQQKEFIEYMNKIIKELELLEPGPGINNIDEELNGYLIQRVNTFKEILSKYKEIIGGINEKECNRL